MCLLKLRLRLLYSDVGGFRNSSNAYPCVQSNRRKPINSVRLICREDLHRCRLFFVVLCLVLQQRNFFCMHVLQLRNFLPSFIFQRTFAVRQRRNFPRKLLCQLLSSSSHCIVSHLRCRRPLPFQLGSRFNGSSSYC